MDATTKQMNGNANGHANGYTNGHSNGHSNGYANGNHKEMTKPVGSEGELLVERLTVDDVKALAKCYDLAGRTVSVDPLREVTRQSLLPKVAKRMGWAEANCRKLRANDVQSVTIRYNSDFHRDRHLYGGEDSEELKKAAWTNLSAVIYLDKSSFEYIEDSSYKNPKEQKVVTNTFEGGTMIIFPSSLVHKARPIPDNLKASNSRRTLIMFDIECAGVNDVPHAIVCMPAIFQRPALHVILSELAIQRYVLRTLFSGSMYAWRFMPRWCRSKSITRVHWQITTPKDVGPDESKIVALNASIYMPKPEKPTSTVYFYDYRNMIGYLLRLLDAYTFGFFFTR